MRDKKVRSKIEESSPSRTPPPIAGQRRSESCKQRRLESEDAIQAIYDCQQEERDDDELPGQQQSTVLTDVTADNRPPPNWKTLLLWILVLVLIPPTTLFTPPLIYWVYTSHIHTQDGNFRKAWKYYNYVYYFTMILYMCLVFLLVVGCGVLIIKDNLLQKASPVPTDASYEMADMEYMENNNFDARVKSQREVHHTGGASTNVTKVGGGDVGGGGGGERVNGVEGGGGEGE